MSEDGCTRNLQAKRCWKGGEPVTSRLKDGMLMRGRRDLRKVFSSPQHARGVFRLFHHPRMKRVKVTKENMHLTMEGLREEGQRQCPLTPQMVELMNELRVICKNGAVQEAYNRAAANVIAVLDSGEENPWKRSTVDDFVEYFEHWFTFLPRPKSGMDRILPFIWFYTSNAAAMEFLNTFKSCREGESEMRTEIFNWTVKFIRERGRFMDSTESLLYVREWMKDENAHMEDFEMPANGFQSFNEFFTRRLNMKRNPRPIAGSDDDRVITAPADTVIKFMISDLELWTQLDVKGRGMKVGQLLRGSRHAKEFRGGTAISFVLLPDVYHHYHAPVGGEIIEGAEVGGIYHGMVDGEHWFDDVLCANGRNRDFSIFEDFHRAYYIIRTQRFGLVALIAVGLNTISRLTATVIGRKSTMVKDGQAPVAVKKGDELGYFAYGGSLNIVLFQRDLVRSLSVQMGQQIGLFPPL